MKPWPKAISQVQDYDIMIQIKLYWEFVKRPGYIFVKRLGCKCLLRDLDAHVTIVGELRGNERKKAYHRSGPHFTYFMDNNA